MFVQYPEYSWNSYLK